MRPLLLDLFCGAGGCGVGYQRAGFDVLGVDIVEHPTCPYPHLVGDACELLADYPEFCQGFDVIHASPPCQAHTHMSNRYRGQGGVADAHVDLIPEVRRLLQATGRPYVIENVVGAKGSMRDGLLLHGGMFGLGVHRPRLFEVSVPVAGHPAAPATQNPLGVYGVKPDGRRLWTRADGTEQRAAKGLEAGQRAMGIDWMDWPDLTESIPPAYTEWLGKQLLAHLGAFRAA